MHSPFVKTLVGFIAIVSAQLLFISPAQAASTFPTAPQSVTARPGPASLTLNWSAPSDTATGITYYIVQYSTDGSNWNTASSTIAGSATSFTISSLIVNTPYYTRIAAIASTNQGPYGYPWTKIYGVNSAYRDSNGHIQYQTGYGIATGDTATSLTNSAFTRVRYKMQTTISSTSSWADVDFAKWDTQTNVSNSTNPTFTVPGASLSTIQVPTTNSTNNLSASEQITVKTNVSDLTVNSSLSSLVRFGKNGRLENWPWNYATNVTGITPAGNGSYYDADDSPAMNANYGSFQVFDVTSSPGSTIFVWNAQSTSAPDVGYGDYGTAGSSNIDWTFSQSFSSGSSLLLEIFVNTPISTNFQGTGTVAINTISGSINKRTTKAITANTAGPGYVTFYFNGRKVANCINVPTVANVATCNWRPIITGQQTLSASFTSSDGSYTAANSTTLNATAKKR